MKICNGWRRFLICLPIIFFLPYLFSVLDLHHTSNIEKLPKSNRNKFDHLVLGPAAGQGLRGRLQCQGIQALNKTHLPNMSHIPKSRDVISFVTVFTIYNTSISARVYDRSTDLVTVGDVSYSKTERSMAVLNIFINFIQKNILNNRLVGVPQVPISCWAKWNEVAICTPEEKNALVSMPLSKIFILTDPASEFSIPNNRVTVLPIQGEYSRDKLMLQRIRSYIAFLGTRLEELSQRQGQIHHYIFTDSDIAVVDDLGEIFYNHPKFHIAVTFRNNRDQPLNSGFIAVRGTHDGIRRAKLFLQEVLDIYSSKYMKASRMLGDQLALAWVVKSHLSLDAKRFTRPQAFVEDIDGTSVLFLPCAIYNWTPPEGAGQFHGMPLDVKVVHFKGSRKRLMLESWNFYNSSASAGISDMLCLILMSGRTKYDF